MGCRNDQRTVELYIHLHCWWTRGFILTEYHQVRSEAPPYYALGTIRHKETEGNCLYLVTISFL